MTKSKFGTEWNLTIAFMIVIIAVAGLTLAAYVYSRPPCCFPEPPTGQLSLVSYNFQQNGSSGSLFAVFGIFKGQNVSLQQVFFDQILLTRENSGLNATCGIVPVSTFYTDQCTVLFTFGPSLPAPTAGSIHTLKIVASTGVSSVFQVTSGYLYHATNTPAYQEVNVSGTVFQGCVGSAPMSVTFGDQSGNQYTTNVTSANGSWTYLISLTSGYTYNVSVSYKAVVPNAPMRTANAGSLALGVEMSGYTYNIPC